VSKAKSHRHSRRLNRRALIILGVATLIVVPGLIGLKLVRDRASGATYLREARAQIKEKRTTLALGYLNRYLELNPDDLDAMELKAQVLSDAAVTDPQAQEALSALTQVLGRTPKGPRSQDARRRLVKLALRMPNRANVAEEQARQLLAEGADDAEAHRLHAQALQFLGVIEKNSDRFEEARKEYEAAEAKEPGDVVGAEQLAYLYRERLEDPKKASEVLDRLVERTANDPKKKAAALLARARHLSEIGRSPRLEAAERNALAQRIEADIVAAVAADTGSVDARLLAAEVALQAPRFDTAAARLHLSQISPEGRNDLRVKTMEGFIELAEQRPEDAVAAWRAGLVRAGGTDEGMTWRLAVLLLDSGRVAEAEKLIEQFRRLTGGETPTPRYDYLRGMALLRSGHPREAIATLEGVRYKIEKNLEPYLYHGLGQAYEQTHETSKAVDSYRVAAEMSLEWSSPWVALARLQADTQLATAEATLRKGLALMPADSRMATALALLLWRREMQKPEPQRSWAEVEQMLTNAQKAAPGSAEVALVQADFYTSTHRPDDAIALLRTAAGLSARTTDLWLALANALTRRGQLGQALDVLDEATKSNNAGPNAGLTITRARILVFMGRASDARKALTDALEKVPAGQKPLLWKTLGELYLVQKDETAARAAYAEWARSDPQNPEPSVALFQLALAKGDDTAIERAIDDLKRVGGPDAYYWRYGQVENLLRNRPGETPDPKRDAKRLDDAQTLITQIQKNDPQIPLGYLLEARLDEKRGDVPKAIAAFRKAIDLKAGAAALNPLIGLLVREGRDDELKRLRQEYPGDQSSLDRLAAVQALRSGHKDRAEALAAMAVQGDPKGLDVRVWQAEVLQALGKPREAEDALRKMIAQKPSESVPWLQLLMLQISQKQRDQAAATVEQIRARVKTDFPELLWAQCYRSLNNIPKADECYQLALRKWPNDMAVLSSAVTFYEQLGRRDEAEAVLRSIRSHDPSNGWASRKLALSLAGRSGNRGAWEEALALVGPERRRDDVADDLLIRADVYARGPEPAHRTKAIAILEELLAELPSLNRVHEQVGRILFAIGDSPRAREHAAKAADASARPDTILFYAGVLLALNDISAAEDQLHRLAAIEPDSLPVAELRAKILGVRGRPEEGAQVLEKAFSDRASGVAPTAPAELIELGRTTVSVLSSAPLNQLDAAERVARKLAALGPKGQCILAEVLAARGKPDEAVAALEAAGKADESAAAAAVALNLAAQPGADRRWAPLAEKLFAADTVTDPNAPERLNQLALLRHLKGEFEKEIATYQQLLAAKPSNFLFLNNMAWTLSEELKRPADGLKWADEAIQRAGAIPQVLDTRGVILTRLDRLSDAVKDLETAAAALKDPAVDYHLARVYRKLGKTEDARKFRDRAKGAGLTRERLQSGDQADWDEVMN
jgi:tetratricopeptide (TPR) repeat protein